MTNTDDKNTQHTRYQTVVSMRPETIVRLFWDRMATNNFYSAMEILSEDFVMEWPQSKERIRGPENFARMNSEYPTNGSWQFRINRLVAGETEVVTQVSVTDGEQHAEPISFFTIVNGRITRLVEYWPDPFPAAPNRKHLVELME